jgi:carbon-monoxide dehydrogenase small subunit
VKHKIQIKVNGRDNEIEVDPWRTLLEVLRDQLNLTGTKQSCAEGHCGACTVFVDGEAVNACLMLALEAHGSDIMTIEGLAKGGKLHPIQEAFVDYGAVQCGFCTPGMIMTAHQLLQDNAEPSEDEIRHGLEGNLCRCTGYQNIVRAVQSAAAEMRGG